eukprot:scaffold647881_cov46-Prasinocladus_malaysianus.AAC.1
MFQIVYFDGQFNDARMNVSLAVSAAHGGAAVANHTEVVSLIKVRKCNSSGPCTHACSSTQPCLCKFLLYEFDFDADGRVIGANVKDLERGRKFSIYAKVVINATGPFVDSVRHMSNESEPNMITPSAGVHLVLPDYYSAKTHGLIVPRTKDGRVLFVLPWERHTIAGTTDSETSLTMRPKPTEKEIDFILEEIEHLLTVK